MSVSLAKGQNGPLDVSDVVVSVQLAAAADLSALLVTSNGKVRSDADFVFFNQPTGPGVQLVPNPGGIASLRVSLAGVPADIEQVRAVITLDDASSNFGRTAAPTARVSDAAGNVLYEYVIDGLTTESIVIALEGVPTPGCVEGARRRPGVRGWICRAGHRSRCVGRRCARAAAAHSGRGSGADHPALVRRSYTAGVQPAAAAAAFVQRAAGSAGPARVQPAACLQPGTDAAGLPAGAAACVQPAADVQPGTPGASRAEPSRRRSSPR